MNEEEAKAAVAALEGAEMGVKRLRVELARGDGAVRAREKEREKELAPTASLFVVNFAPGVKESDLEAHLGQWAPVARCELRRNFAFVTFATVDDAKAALEGGNGSSLGDRVLTCQYRTAEASGGRERRAGPPGGNRGGGRFDDRRMDRYGGGGGGYGRYDGPPRGGGYREDRGRDYRRRSRSRSRRRYRSRSRSPRRERRRSLSRSRSRGRRRRAPSRSPPRRGRSPPRRPRSPRSMSR